MDKVFCAHCGEFKKVENVLFPAGKRPICVACDLRRADMRKLWPRCRPLHQSGGGEQKTYLDTSRMKEPPLVICSTEGVCLPLMLYSVLKYAPFLTRVYLSCPSEPHGDIADIAEMLARLSLIPNTGKSFGESYNAAVHKAFSDGHESVIVANDDVVLTPDTWRKMLEDIESLEGTKVGWVAARSDWARGLQNIRFKHPGEELRMLRWPSEDSVLRAGVVAPIFAWISKEAWVDFPHINWYSDDIQCLDVTVKGFQHYVSRAYVHHVGAQSCGFDANKLTQEAFDWIKINRPDIATKWGIK